MISLKTALRALSMTEGDEQQICKNTNSLCHLLLPKPSFLLYFGQFSELHFDMREP
jgi:hypothetical protein